MMGDDDLPTRRYHRRRRSANVVLDISHLDRALSLRPQPAPCDGAANESLISICLCMDDAIT
jgi:hypothetical protein